ncbi:MAG: ATP-binding protein [Bacteroidota bacterium]
MLLFSQRSAINKIDSVGYYIELVKFHKKNNAYKECLVYSQKAIDYAIRSNNKEQLANSYSNLATIYFDLKRNDDAIDKYQKSIAYYATIPPSANQAYTFYNLGLCYMEKNNFSMAETNFDKAKSIYQTIKIPSAIELINLQKGIVYKQKGKTTMAMQLFNEIISKKDTSDTYKTKAEALYHVGVIELDKNRINLAKNYLDKAYTISTSNNDIEEKAKIVLALSKVYEKQLDFKKTNELLKQHLTLKDSIEELNALKIGVDDFNTFKNIERLKSIEQLDKENKSKAKAKTFSKLVSILAIALISILSLLSLSLYKNNIIRNRSNSLLQEKNKELEIAKEKAEKATKSRSEFLSTVSHELRTPLNAINGITHLLLEENPNKSQMNYLNSLQFSGNYLIALINDILEINRIESQNIPIEKINFNLKLLLHNIQNSLKEVALENKNTFTIEVDESIPNNLIGDPTKLSQIFMNLINNSLKFTKKGYVNVVARMNTLDEDGKISISFKVADNGIGIPEDKLETIFESFSQGSIEINRKYGGTGLGLAIVKKLIELLGGNIYLNSKVGLGSTFSFELPFEVSNTVLLPIEKQNFNEEVVFDKKILLVEDNKINQMITKKMLENKKMSCFIVDNGEDSVELMKNENDFDLILMDVHLPGINGTIATQQIREFNTKIPIVALTAISLNENREMLISYGMTDVLTKPFEPEKFYQIIARYLST